MTYNFNTNNGYVPKVDKYRRIEEGDHITGRLTTEKDPKGTPIDCILIGESEVEYYKKILRDNNIEEKIIFFTTSPFGNQLLNRKAFNYPNNIHYIHYENDETGKKELLKFKLESIETIEEMIEKNRKTQENNEPKRK